MVPFMDRSWCLSPSSRQPGHVASQTPAQVEHRGVQVLARDGDPQVQSVAASATGKTVPHILAQVGRERATRRCPRAVDRAAATHLVAVTLPWLEAEQFQHRGQRQLLPRGSIINPRHGLPPGDGTEKRNPYRHGSRRRSRNALRRTLLSCGAYGRRHVPTAPPTPPTLCPRRVALPASVSTSWPVRCRAKTDTLPPRMPSVGEREVAAAQQTGDFAGVDLVVLGLAAVDGLHVQGVSQDEGDVLSLAQVGEPVPGEHALDADDESGAEGCDGAEKALRPAGQVFVEDDESVVVEDADVHGPGVQVDAAVESVGLVVEAHGILPRNRWGPEPGSWLEGASFLKLPRGDKVAALISILTWDRLPPIPQRP